MPIDSSISAPLPRHRPRPRARPSAHEIVAAAVRGGATMVQLREKAATTRAFLEEARALKALLAPLGVRLSSTIASTSHWRSTPTACMSARPICRSKRRAACSAPARSSACRSPTPRRSCAPTPRRPIISASARSISSRPRKTPRAPLGVEGFRRLRALTQKPVARHRRSQARQQRARARRRRRWPRRRFGDRRRRRTRGGDEAVRAALRLTPWENIGSLGKISSATSHRRKGASMAPRWRPRLRAHAQRRRRQSQEHATQHDRSTRACSSRHGARQAPDMRPERAGPTTPVRSSRDGGGRRLSRSVGCGLAIPRRKFVDPLGGMVWRFRLDEGKPRLPPEAGFHEGRRAYAEPR